MEGRRVEGVFLDSSILRSRAQEAYRASRTMEIRVLSSVPEALLASLGGPGSKFTAFVKEVTPQRVVLMLENGYEIHAENRLSQPIREGERLSLMVESRDPLVLRVESGLFTTGLKEIWRTILKEGVNFIRLVPEKLKESLENSGLVYEKKVWNFLRGEIERSSLERDTKYVLLRRLSSMDTSRLEQVIRSADLPEGLTRRAEEVLRSAEAGNRIGFLMGVRELSYEASRLADLLSNEIESLSTAIAERVRSLTLKLTEVLRNLGLKVSLNRNALEGFLHNPRSLDLIRSIVESLKLNRWNETVEKFRIVGLNIKNPERIPLVRDHLIRQIEPLIRGAVQGLLEDIGAEDIRGIVETLKRKREDLEKLRDFSESLERAVPKGVRENLQRVDLIGYLQSYMVAKEGRKFILPFRTEDGRGIILFSAEGVFRILIRLSYDEGFVGVIMETPRKEKPTHISLTFLTDIPGLKEEIETRFRELKEDLKDVGLEVSRFEVKRLNGEEFEKRILEDLGEETSFTLRV